VRLSCFIFLTGFFEKIHEPTSEIPALFKYPHAILQDDFDQIIWSKKPWSISTCWSYEAFSEAEGKN